MTVTYGKENLEEKPMTGWRLWIRTNVIRPICKVTVFACGFHRVKINGTRADRSQCRIIVAAPHTTFMDGLVFFVLDLPIVVMARMTIFSYIARGAQAIIVKRRKAGHGKRKLEPIIARSDPNTTWPQLLIFPEGTTTNGACLISFKSGKQSFTLEFHFFRTCIRFFFQTRRLYAGKACSAFDYQVWKIARGAFMGQTILVVY